MGSETEEPHARTRQGSGVKSSLDDSKETGPQSYGSKELDYDNSLSELGSGILPQSFQKETLPCQCLDLVHVRP